MHPRTTIKTYLASVTKIPDVEKGILIRTEIPEHVIVLCEKKSFCALINVKTGQQVSTLPADVYAKTGGNITALPDGSFIYSEIQDISATDEKLTANVKRWHPNTNSAPKTLLSIPAKRSLLACGWRPDDYTVSLLDDQQFVLATPTGFRLYDDKTPHLVHEIEYRDANKAAIVKLSATEHAVSSIEHPLEIYHKNSEAKEYKSAKKITVEKSFYLKAAMLDTHDELMNMNVFLLRLPTEILCVTQFLSTHKNSYYTFLEFLNPDTHQRNRLYHTKLLGLIHRISYLAHREQLIFASAFVNHQLDLKTRKITELVRNSGLLLNCGRIANLVGDQYVYTYQTRDITTQQQSVNTTQTRLNPDYSHLQRTDFARQDHVLVINKPSEKMTAIAATLIETLNGRIIATLPRNIINPKTHKTISHIPFNLKDYTSKQGERLFTLPDSSFIYLNCLKVNSLNPTSRIAIERWHPNNTTPPIRLATLKIGDCQNLKDTSIASYSVTVLNENEFALAVFGCVHIFNLATSEKNQTLEFKNTTPAAVVTLPNACIAISDNEGAVSFYRKKSPKKGYKLTKAHPAKSNSDYYYQHTFLFSLRKELLQVRTFQDKNKCNYADLCFFDLTTQEQTQAYTYRLPSKLFDMTCSAEQSALFIKFTLPHVYRFDLAAKHLELIMPSPEVKDHDPVTLNHDGQYFVRGADDMLSTSLPQDMCDQLHDEIYKQLTHTESNLKFTFPRGIAQLIAGFCFLRSSKKEKEAKQVTHTNTLSL